VVEKADTEKNDTEKNDTEKNDTEKNDTKKNDTEKAEVVKAEKKTRPRSPLRKLDVRHCEAISMKLDGLHYNEIAEKLGVSQQTVKQWFTEPIVKAQVAELTRESMDAIKAKLVKGAKSAAETLLTINKRGDIKSPTTFYAARDILDRVGMKAGSKVELTGPGGGPIQVDHNIKLEDRKKILEAALRAVSVLEDGEAKTIYEAEVTDDGSE